jgi:hypothetical protein
MGGKRWDLCGVSVGDMEMERICVGRSVWEDLCGKICAGRSVWDKWRCEDVHVGDVIVSGMWRGGIWQE